MKFYLVTQGDCDLVDLRPPLAVEFPELLLCLNDDLGSVHRDQPQVVEAYISVIVTYLLIQDNPAQLKTVRSSSSFEVRMKARECNVRSSSYRCSLKKLKYFEALTSVIDIMSIYFFSHIIKANSPWEQERVDRKCPLILVREREVMDGIA